MASVRLSKKHGANPTMGICFFCGKPTGEIALLGRLKDDAEAPKYSILDYTPCVECKKVFKEGVLLIETDDNVQDVAPITTDSDNVPKYPTGRWCVITEEGANKAFKNSFAKGSAVCVDSEIFSAFMPEKNDTVSEES